MMLPRRDLGPWRGWRRELYMERAARVPVCGSLLRMRYIRLSAVCGRSPRGSTCLQHAESECVFGGRAVLNALPAAPRGSQSGGRRAWKEIVGILIVFIRTGDEREPELGMARVSPR